MMSILKKFFLDKYLNFGAFALQEIIEEAKRAGLNVSVKATLEISILD
jgi:hypothetical protein